MRPSLEVALARRRRFRRPSFEFLKSNARQDTEKKAYSCVPNAFTTDRPGPGGVVYIQQILVNDNKRVLMNAKGNPRLKTEEAINATIKVF